MYVLSHLRGGDIMSITMEIAKRSDGNKINTFGELENSKKKVSVALWTAGPKKFLLLKRSKKFVGFEELPKHTSLSEATEAQELTLVAMEGGKA